MRQPPPPDIKYDGRDRFCWGCDNPDSCEFCKVILSVAAAAFAAATTPAAAATAAAPATATTPATAAAAAASAAATTPTPAAAAAASAAATTPAATAAASGCGVQGSGSAAATTPSAAADGPRFGVQGSLPVRKFRRLAKTEHHIDLEADPMDACDVCKAHDHLSECQREPQCWKLLCRGCNKQHKHTKGDTCPSCMKWVDDLDVNPDDPKCPACGSYDAPETLPDNYDDIETIHDDDSQVTVPATDHC